MRLHEYYFENMNPAGGAPNETSTLHKKIAKEFGSIAKWEKDFKAVGAIRGIGWTILYHDAVADRLFNVWINEHEIGHLVGGKPILILDVFEHAYITDYGIKRGDYIETFFKAINWRVVEGRLS